MIRASSSGGVAVRPVDQSCDFDEEALSIDDLNQFCLKETIVVSFNSEVHRGSSIPGQETSVMDLLIRCCAIESISPAKHCLFQLSVLTADMTPLKPSRLVSNGIYHLFPKTFQLRESLVKIKVLLDDSLVTKSRGCRHEYLLCGMLCMYELLEIVSQRLRLNLFEMSICHQNGCRDPLSMVKDYQTNPNRQQTLNGGFYDLTFHIFPSSRLSPCIPTLTHEIDVLPERKRSILSRFFKRKSKTNSRRSVLSGSSEDVSRESTPGVQQQVSRSKTLQPAQFDQHRSYSEIDGYRSPHSFQSRSSTPAVATPTSKNYRAPKPPIRDDKLHRKHYEQVAAAANANTSNHMKKHTAPHPPSRAKLSDNKTTVEPSSNLSPVMVDVDVSPYAIATLGSRTFPNAKEEEEILSNPIYAVCSPPKYSQEMSKVDVAMDSSASATTPIKEDVGEEDVDEPIVTPEFRKRGDDDEDLACELLQLVAGVNKVVDESGSTSTPVDSYQGEVEDDIDFIDEREEVIEVVSSEYAEPSEIPNISILSELDEEDSSRQSPLAEPEETILLTSEEDDNLSIDRLSKEDEQIVKSLSTPAESGSDETPPSSGGRRIIPIKRSSTNLSEELRLIRELNGFGSRNVLKTAEKLKGTNIVAGLRTLQMNNRASVPVNFPRENRAPPVAPKPVVNRSRPQSTDVESIIGNVDHIQKANLLQSIETFNVSAGLRKVPNEMKRYSTVS